MAVCGLVAQPKDIKFQEVGEGSFAGFTQDEKAERAWEAKAKVMKPTAEPNVWDVTQLRVQSFREGQPYSVFESPFGFINPEKKTAKGMSPVTVSSPLFKVTGQGWDWTSTGKGEIFAIYADVKTELDLSKPITRRLHIKASRLDATPADAATLLVYTGSVLLERFGERMTCERLECLVESGSGNENSYRYIRAIGKVVHVAEGKTLKGDTALFMNKEQTVEVKGQVELIEPAYRGVAHYLFHEIRLNQTRLDGVDGLPVQMHAMASNGDSSDITGDHVLVQRNPSTSVSNIKVDGHATYTSDKGRLTAQKMNALAMKEKEGVLEADGFVKGQVEGATFESGHAVWNRASNELDLTQQPQLKDARGIIVTGYTIWSDLNQHRMVVNSNADHLATIHLPAGEDGAPGLAQAQKIYVTEEGNSTEMDLVGAVHYQSGDKITDSDRLVAFGTPAGRQRHDLQLRKAILTGHVRYAQVGLKAEAERIDYVPAVKIQEVLPQDNLTGRPDLLTLSGGEDTSRPKLYITFSNGQSARFIADAQEILSTPKMTKFFLRGKVGMNSDEATSTCDLLEGILEAQGTQQQSAREVIGRGNVTMLTGGSTAQGQTLEFHPKEGEVRLYGDARIRDQSGKEGIPAKELVYNMKEKAWHMNSAPSSTLPGQVVRPKIFLGDDFTLPGAKSLDNGR
jgi:lipopolysaccharide export system protein LptA